MATRNQQQITSIFWKLFSAGSTLISLNLPNFFYFSIAAFVAIVDSPVFPISLRKYQQKGCKQ